MKKGFKRMAVLLLALLLTIGMCVPAAQAAEKTITKAKAVSIALKNAGVKAAQAVILKTKLDREDLEWDVEFRTTAKKYEYEINAVNGKILEKKVQKLPSAQKYITPAKAKKLALKAVDVKAGKAKKLTVELEVKGKKVWYEVEFKVGKVEYEIRLNPVTGKVQKIVKDKD